MLMTKSKYFKHEWFVLDVFWLTLCYSGPEQENQLCSFEDVLSYLRKYIKSIYPEFMRGCSKHLSSNLNIVVNIQQNACFKTV